jgi:hypothetical protein
MSTGTAGRTSSARAAGGSSRRSPPTCPGSSTPRTWGRTAPTCSPTTWTTTASPTSSAARPTITASGGTSRSRGHPAPTFLRHDLFPHLFSQTHALHFVDIDGDGLKDLVTGKRWWAHGPKGDIDPNDPAKLFWFKARKSRDGLTTFEPRPIDNDSGVGTQFTIADVNGDKAPDIVVANKKGVFLFEQVRSGR